MKLKAIGSRFMTLALFVIFLFGILSIDGIIAQSNACNNVLGNAIVVDYSTYYNDDFVPENLIDGNQNRSWSSAEGDTQPYITFDLGETFEIDQLQFNGYFQANDIAYQGDSIKEFQLEALVEEQWIPVISAESPLQDRLVTYSFSDAVVTDQVKIVFLSNHGGTAFEAAELVICGQRARGASSGTPGGKQASGKENPENEPLLYIQGTLAENNEDVWTFEGTQNQIVSVELQANTRGAYLALHEPDGDRMAYDEAYSNYVDLSSYAEILGVRLLQNGTYSIVVKNTIGPYTLQVHEGYFGETIGTIAPGESQQGNLAENGFNRWLVDLSAGQIISIELQSFTRGGYVALYEPDGVRMHYDEAYGDYVNDTYYGGIFGSRILTEGLYMIFVSNLIGPYTLTVNEGYFGATVGTVAPGQSVQGNLAEHGFNRWLVTVSQGQTVTLNLQSSTRGAYLALYDPVGDRVSYDEAYSESGTGYRADLQYRILTTGVYMIYVSNMIGDYTLSVSTQ